MNSADLQSVIYRTKGLCPDCCLTVEARAVELSGKVYLEKICPADGVSRLLLCHDAAYFRALRIVYETTHKEVYPQTRYLVLLTRQCNLACPICFLDPQLSTGEDVGIDEALRLGDDGHKELILFGAEPTLRPDLPELIRKLKKRQYSLSLYSNGINLARREYCETLKKSGVDKVYFQFDGFNDNVYKLLRKKELVNIKNEALSNLKRLDVPVVLDVAVVKGVNDDQIKAIFEYACQESNIKALNFIAYVRSGCGRDYLSEKALMPDDIIEYFINYTGGRISRENMLIYQKLLYVYMGILKRRTCFYIQYFWIYRQDNGEYLTLDQILDFPRLEKYIDGYLTRLRGRSQFGAFVYLAINLVPILSAVKQLKIFQEMFKMAFAHAFKIKEYAGRGSRFLQLIFTTACDAHKSDENITRQCHVGIAYKDEKGELRVDNENSAYLLNKEIKKVSGQS